MLTLYNRAALLSPCAALRSDGLGVAANARAMAPCVPATAIPTSAHLNSLFARCVSSLPLLRQLHARLLLLHGLPLSTALASRLAHAYFVSASARDARHVFDQIPHRTPHAWNTMFAGYYRARLLPELLLLYKLSHSHNHRPDSFALAFALRACAGLSLLGPGSSIHSQAIRSGLDANAFVSPPLMNMYVDLGSLDDAEKMFNCVNVADSACWGLMMKGYSRASVDEQVFDLFGRMKELKLELDPCAAVCLARACGNICAAKEGRAIHGFCIKTNYLDCNIYLKTSLVDMYGKSGFIDFALKLFDEMPSKDVVSWSSVISGLAQCRRGYEALRVFRDMLEESIMPNEVTYASVLLACAHLGASFQGKSVHGFMIRSNIELDVVTNTALVDMYAKCGFPLLAYKVFGIMPVRNVFSWSAMIGAFGAHGMYLRALDLFDEMRSANLAPNHVTFVSVLSACSHSGMVKDGRIYFESMTKDYKITPTNEHYCCMVDLLGRAGLIEEAQALIEEMPVKPSASVWGALLGACRIHKRVELAEKVAEKLFVLEPNQPGAHVLLSNIYAAAEMWEMVKKTRDVMNKRGLRKTFGYSTIEVDKMVYIFNVMDRRNRKDNEILEFWRELSNQMKELGYVPDLSFTLHDVDDESKEEVLCGHSEKMAMAFGLLRTKDGIPLRITKNLRVCGDCHTASKFISLITKREIIVRDSRRFHHVKNGVCSCGDYW
ncbi:pentatricopeptide repeat-containing protein At1g06140, mitochondrial [Ananas comosus]|uniref:Pentatricopeptide repeat-containing protein At1g06140, mitochondrial n=1 Tax=Ananas comosus TaxID=4615 RepID=A0A6P5H6V2_ANACO|nr:pentatricopeptide repeat-containing protein At1g06140, mitochondrial [Ananas comosus]